MPFLCSLGSLKYNKTRPRLGLVHKGPDPIKPRVGSHMARPGDAAPYKSILTSSRFYTCQTPENIRMRNHENGFPRHIPNQNKSKKQTLQYIVTCSRTRKTKPLRTQKNPPDLIVRPQILHLHFLAGIADCQSPSAGESMHDSYEFMWTRTWENLHGSGCIFYRGPHYNPKFQFVHIVIKSPWHIILIDATLLDIIVAL